MIPYAASVGWYARWLHALDLGMSQGEAAAFANREEHITGKGFTRCRITGVSGKILLSVPVEGGAAKLKRESEISGLTLSEHGNWRHVHQGALNAAYGRSPYFQHLMPLLEEAYSSPEKSLSGFTSLLHEVFTTFLLGEYELPSLTKSAEDRGKELAPLIPMEISIIDPLMRLGRETLLFLLMIKDQYSPRFLTLNS